MKKIVSVLSIITLIIILTVTPSYANDADVILTTSSETVKPGDTITLTVTINETQDGIAGLQGKVQWNAEQLTYISSQVGTDFTTLNFNDDTTSEALGTFTVYGDNYITTGANVFTITFEVNSKLTAETQINIDITGIKAVYQTAGTVDIQDKSVNLSVANNMLDEEPIPEENTNTTNQIPTATTNSIQQSAVVDNTTAKTELPATGLTIIIICAILILAVILIISGKKYIQYLKDTRKQLK